MCTLIRFDLALPQLLSAARAGTSRAGPAAMASVYSVDTKEDAEAAKPCDKPLSSLTKVEAKQWLQALGEEPGARWTSVEIKSRIKEILDTLEDKEGKLPKNFSALKKAQLIEECHKRGIDTTTHETRGSMMRKIRNQVEMESGGTGTSLMGMGKHSDRSYQEVKDDDPSYVRWATETVQEEGMRAHWKLRKFVAWIQTQENKKPEKEKDASSARTSSSQRSAATPSSVTVRSARMSSAAPSTASARTAKRSSPEEATDDPQYPWPMDAKAPVLVETPATMSKTEGLMINALERLGERLDKLERVKEEKEESMGSWQDAAASSHQK